MGAEETKIICELGFNEDGFLEDKIVKHLPTALKIRIRLEKDKKRIDVRAVEGSELSGENIFEYNPDGTVSLKTDYSASKRLYCKSHILSIFPYDLAAHFFGRDDEGRVINMHGATVCTGCEYFMKGRK